MMEEGGRSDRFMANWADPCTVRTSCKNASTLRQCCCFDFRSFFRTQHVSALTNTYTPSTRTAQ